jgi:hypothetical protein
MTLQNYFKRKFKIFSKKSWQKIWKYQISACATFSSKDGSIYQKKIKFLLRANLSFLRANLGLSEGKFKAI